MTKKMKMKSVKREIDSANKRLHKDKNIIDPIVGKEYKDQMAVPNEYRPLKHKARRISSIVDAIKDGVQEQED